MVQKLLSEQNNLKKKLSEKDQLIADLSNPAKSRQKKIVRGSEEQKKVGSADPKNL